MENNNNAMEIILVGAILVCATIAIGGQYILKKAISDSICKSFEKQILERHKPINQEKEEDFTTEHTEGSSTIKYRNNVTGEIQEAEWTPDNLDAIMQDSNNSLIFD